MLCHILASFAGLLASSFLSYFVQVCLEIIAKKTKIPFNWFFLYGDTEDSRFFVGLIDMVEN